LGDLAVGFAVAEALVLRGGPSAGGDLLAQLRAPLLAVSAASGERWQDERKDEDGGARVDRLRASLLHGTSSMMSGGCGVLRGAVVGRHVEEPLVAEVLVHAVADLAADHAEYVGIGDELDRLLLHGTRGVDEARVE